MLDIYAGKNALKTIQEHGFKQELFSSMLGASGGPKWFTLFGLDKYLFGEFFNHRTTELTMLGSSAGAFRFAALAQKKPVEAITRLAHHYAHTQYSVNATATEITAKAIELIDALFGEQGIKQLLANPVYKTHFIISRCQGLTSFESSPLQLAGLLSSVLLNRLDRKLLRHQYQRVVFHATDSTLEIADPCQFDTHYVALTATNTKAALLASGSIPLVMKGVKNIQGAPAGMYRDGGIIDYHFDIGIKPNTGLILYPHFNASPKAGWFDKSLQRTVNSKHYDKTVLLVPSAQFIARLPHGKIPDRKDFTQMDAPSRISYWQTVLAESERLAEQLDRVINTQNLAHIQAIK